MNLTTARHFLTELLQTLLEQYFTFQMIGFDNIKNFPVKADNLQVYRCPKLSYSAKHN